MRHENEIQSLSSFQRFTGGDIKFRHVRAVEIVDLRINYQKGAPIAYIRPVTTRGRRWLWESRWVSVLRIERDRGPRAVARTHPANGRRRIDDSLAVVKFTMTE
jgi:hypothetical protein